MNYETEQAVWRRVRGPGEELSAGKALLPERLEALLLEEQATEAQLRALARRTGGNRSRVLQRLANRTGKRIGELSALHFLLTGRRLRLKPPAFPGKVTFPDSLRAVWLRQQQSARAYDSLAKEFREEAQELETWSSGIRADNRQLASLLQGRMSGETDL